MKFTLSILKAIHFLQKLEAVKLNTNVALLIKNFLLLGLYYTLTIWQFYNQTKTTMKTETYNENKNNKKQQNRTFSDCSFSPVASFLLWEGIICKSKSKKASKKQVGSSGLILFLLP